MNNQNIFLTRGDWYLELYMNGAHTHTHTHVKQNKRRQGPWVGARAG